MAKKTKNFLKDINKGGLTAKAKKAGKLNPDGTINKAWIEKETKSKDPKTKKEAILAQNMSKWNKGKKKSK